VIGAGSKRASGRAVRRARVVVACALLVGCALVSLASRAHADELLHYDPPGVDAVYPLDGTEPASAAEGDGGVPPSSPAATPDAPLVPTAEPPVAKPLPPSEPGPRAGPPASTPAPEATSEPTKGAQAAPNEDYGAQAVVRRAPSEGSREMSLQSARDLPGAFGDPLRILDALPGVVPIASGVPYVYVRGSPPASQGYVYDDIPLPQLYHVGFGPAIIHPRATGAVRFHAGVPPARYGRRAGGLLLAEGTPNGEDFDAELEVRLIDIGGWLQSRVGKGTVSVSGRIGYPKLALVAAEALGTVREGTKLNYWDGQFRYRYPIDSRDHVELIWLGSFDDISLPGVSNVPGAGATGLQFHRVEARLVHRLARGEIGTALRFGYDSSELGSALSVKAFSFGPRFWVQLKHKGHRLRIGGDLFTSQGDVVNGPGTLGSPDGDLKVRLPALAQAPARNQGGVYVESELRVSDEARLDLGLRLDHWSVGSKIDFAVDPRVRATYDLTDKLAVHAAFGLAHQPAVFFLPLPGLTDIALDRGLSRSIQSELGASYQLPRSIRFEVQGFYHRYTKLLLPELVTDASIEEEPPVSDATAYGVEFFIKRDIGETLSGWLGYTLGWAEANSPRSIGRFRPDFDVRHVLNAVVQWNIIGRLTLGTRFHARSGRLIEQLNPRYEQRLPWFVRADVRLGYAWRGRFADMVAYLEWLNVGAQGEYLDADCIFGRCTADRAPPISIPNLGLRAEF
jgi:hypothetical protein